MARLAIWRSGMPAHCGAAGRCACLRRGLERWHVGAGDVAVASAYRLARLARQARPAIYRVSRPSQPRNGVRRRRGLMKMGVAWRGRGFYRAHLSAPSARRIALLGGSEANSAAGCVAGSPAAEARLAAPAGGAWRRRR